MSDNTLLDAIKNLIKKYRLNPYQQSKCEEFFRYVKVGDFIYAGQLKSKLSIDIKDAYLFLEFLKDAGFLINIYEVYCTECSHSKGKFLNSISELDSYTCCDFCNKPLNSIENLIVLYKVVSL